MELLVVQIHNHSKRDEDSLATRNTNFLILFVVVVVTIIIVINIITSGECYKKLGDLAC